MASSHFHDGVSVLCDDIQGSHRPFLPHLPLRAPSSVLHPAQGLSLSQPQLSQPSPSLPSHLLTHYPASSLRVVMISWLSSYPGACHTARSVMMMMNGWLAGECRGAVPSVGELKPRPGRVGGGNQTAAGPWSLYHSPLFPRAQLSPRHAFTTSEMLFE